MAGVLIVLHLFGPPQRIHVHDTNSTQTIVDDRCSKTSSNSPLPQPDPNSCNKQIPAYFKDSHLANLYCGRFKDYNSSSTTSLLFKTTQASHKVPKGRKGTP